MTKYSIFIFRRDLRIFDNVAFNYAISNCDNILPIFIFTPEQISSKYIDYKEINYAKPVVEYKKARKDSITMYRKVL